MNRIAGGLLAICALAWLTHARAQAIDPRAAWALEQGLSREACASQQAALVEIARQEGFRTPRALCAIEGLLTVALSAEQAETALQLSEQLRRLRPATSPADSPDVARARVARAQALRVNDRAAEGRALLDAMLSDAESGAGRRSPGLIAALDGLAALHIDAAQPLLAERDLGDMLGRASRYSEQLAMFESLVGRMQTHLGAADPQTLLTRLRWAMTLGAVGLDKDRIQILDDVFARCRQSIGERSWCARLARYNLADAYADTARWPEAVLAAREGDEEERRLQGERSRVTLNRLIQLGRIQQRAAWGDDAALTLELAAARIELATSAGAGEGVLDDARDLLRRHVARFGTLHAQTVDTRRLPNARWNASAPSSRRRRCSRAWPPASIA